MSQAAAWTDAVPRRAAGRLALAALCLALLALFAGLCAWQIQRRSWKLDLIARVEARIHAPPAAVPGPETWPGFVGADEEYRRVTATGRYLPGRDALVQAVTERGAGSWLLTPLRTASGFVVLVNRGFVPAGRRPAAPDGPVAVTGLLRLPEPGGGFLRANDPTGDRWYSRDVAAIARARGLGAVGSEVAPYFVDADAAGNVPDGPVGGLTVVAFRNTHLVYALTWFALALLAGFGLWRTLVQDAASGGARGDDRAP